MEEKHFIQWIEVAAGAKAYRRFLKPGEVPEAVFTDADLAATGMAGSLSARALCNLHGLWKG